MNDMQANGQSIGHYPPSNFLSELLNLNVTTITKEGIFERMEKNREMFKRLSHCTFELYMGALFFQTQMKKRAISKLLR